MCRWETLAAYWWTGADNFGDQPLNTFLLPRLFPKWRPLPARRPAAILMGIGSILGFRHLIRRDWRKLPWLVFGSGFQYDSLDIPAGSRVFALRGAGTRQLILQREGSDEILAEGCALGDPAVLLPWHLNRDVRPRRGTTCTVMRWDYRGPTSPDVFTAQTGGDIGRWIRRLWSYERIVTDSLHAAIVADAFGMPWRPLRWEFKWQDHFAGLGITAKPTGFVLSNRRTLERMQFSLDAARSRLERFVSEASESGTC